jgi:hypothetical protein
MPEEEPIKVEAEIVPTHRTAPNGKRLFAPGNKLGHGNPFAKRQLEFNRTLMNSVTKKEFRQIMHAMVMKAIDGDVNAARLVVERLCGKIKDDAQVSVTNVNPNSVTICIKQEGDKEPHEPQEPIDLNIKQQ